LETQKTSSGLERRISEAIFFMRGKKVMLDQDLAELYEVETGALNRAVRRNLDRFPEDFLFQLTEKEYEFLRCHFGISKARGGRRYLPFVFTEQGVAMLSSVVRSKRAIMVNIEIMRTFVKLRHVLASHKELAAKLDMLEKKYDAQISIVFSAIRQLMTPEARNRKQIGFRTAREERGLGK